MEIWKDIKNFEGLYEVSNSGRRRIGMIENKEILVMTITIILIPFAMFWGFITLLLITRVLVFLLIEIPFKFILALFPKDEKISEDERPIKTKIIPPGTKR